MASLLDRSLDDIKSQRESGERRSSRGRGAGAGNRSSNRPSPYSRPDSHVQDTDTWKHDKFEDVQGGRGPSRNAGTGSSARLEITNLHWEVSERELETLFTQVGELQVPPKIEFDRSGRSMGRAWITFKEAANAARAKKEFDGASAKGQNITVSFDTSYRGPRPPPSAAPAPGGSLLARLESDSRPAYRGGGGGGGGGRGGGGGATRAPRGAPTGPRGGTGERRPAGDRKPRERPERERKKPVTSADLDSELDAFMTGGNANEAAKADGDTEMAA